MKRSFDLAIGSDGGGKEKDSDAGPSETRFPYPSLQTSTAIRLLHIYRTKDGSISGRLEAFPLDSPLCPQFTALSYVWGPKIRDKLISLNGQHFEVLQNVYPILEFICDLGKFSWIWIDSICIDQQDLEELSSQVQMMSRIYKESKEMVVWLGTATKETDEAIDFFCDLGANKKRLHDLFHKAKVKVFKEIPLEY